MLYGSSCPKTVEELYVPEIIISPNDFNKSENTKLLDLYDKSQKLSLDFFQKGDYKKGLAEGYAAYKISTNLQEGYVAIAFSRMAINILKMGDKLTAKLCHEDALNIFEKIKDPEYASQMGWENVNLGKIYKELGIYDIAETLFKNAEAIFKKLIKEKKQDKFNDYLLNVIAENLELKLNLGQLGEARRLYVSYESSYKTSKNITPIYEAYAREVFSRFFLDLNQAEKAIQQIKAGQSLIAGLPDYYLHPRFFSNLCSAYKKKGDLENAHKHCLEAIKYINKSRKFGFSEFSSINETRTKSKRVFANYFDTASILLAQAEKTELREETFTILQDLGVEDFDMRMSFVLENRESFLSNRDEQLLREKNTKTKRCESIKKQIQNENNFDKKNNLYNSFNECVEEMNRIKGTIEDNSVRNFLLPRAHQKSVLQKNLARDEAVISFFFETYCATSSARSV